VCAARVAQEAKSGNSLIEEIGFAAAFGVFISRQQEEKLQRTKDGRLIADWKVHPDVIELQLIRLLLLAGPVKWPLPSNRRMHPDGQVLKSESYLGDADEVGEQGE